MQLKQVDTADSDKYIYSGTHIYHTGTFTHHEGNFARNVIIFGTDTSRLVYVTNKTQNILVLGKAFIQKINNTTTYAGKMHSPNFSVENNIFVLSLHYNGGNSYLSVNSQKITQFKAKNSAIKANRIFLGSLVGSKAYYDVRDLSKDDVNINKMTEMFTIFLYTIAPFQTMKYLKYTNI